jgi:hypothetical protein
MPTLIDAGKTHNERYRKLKPVVPTGTTAARRRWQERRSRKAPVGYH